MTDKTIQQAYTPAYGPEEVTNISTKRVFAKRGSFVTRLVGNETILVPIQHHVADLDSIYTLNGVAEQVWSMIDGKRDVQSIFDSICQEFDVDRAIAEKDVEELLMELEKAKLIQ